MDMKEMKSVHELGNSKHSQKKFFFGKKCSFEKRNYIIFDQLNPTYSKYFKKHELLNLLKGVGFKKVKIRHRHSYSWLAIAEK